MVICASLWWNDVLFPVPSRVNYDVWQMLNENGIATNGYAIVHLTHIYIYIYSFVSILMNLYIADMVFGCVFAVEYMTRLSEIKLKTFIRNIYRFNELWKSS